MPSRLQKVSRNSISLVKAAQRSSWYSSVRGCFSQVQSQLLRYAVSVHSKRIPGAMTKRERKGVREMRARKDRSREASLPLRNLPRSEEAALTTANPWQSLTNKAQSFQQEGRGLDTSTGVCVMLLQNCSCPVDPFQHQQSLGQKTNLASQGLSVKKDVWGVKETGILFFLWESVEKRSFSQMGSAGPMPSFLPRYLKDTWTQMFPSNSNGKVSGVWL